ncbi:MAG: hypothetical protein U1D30_02370 [Planctomycetota bacterium]
MAYSHSLPTESRRRLPNYVLAILVLAAAIGVFYVGAQHASATVPFTHWRLNHDIVKVIGALLGALSLALIFVPPQAALFATMLMYAGLFAFLVSARRPERGDVEFRLDGRSSVWSSADDYLESNTVPDERYTIRGEPHIQARQNTRDFDVVYTHDSEGWRAMPAPRISPPKGDIVFLGCSFTYGIGVRDDDVYTAILAKEAWPDYRIRDLAYSGWGTTLAYLVLEDVLKQAERPVCVIYAYTPVHLMRNGLRKSWHQKYPQRVAHFDTSGNFLGLIPPEKANLPDSENTLQTEIQITHAVLRRMNELCKKHGVPFLVLQIQAGDEEYHDRLFSDPPITVIDVSDVADENFPNDGHFTPYSNREIALAVARNPNIAKTTGLQDLFQPESVTPNKVLRTDWRPRFTRMDGVESLNIKRDPAHADRIRVEAIRRDPETKKSMEVSRWCQPIEKDKNYCLTLQARADEKTTVAVSVVSRVIPYPSAGLWISFPLSTKWQKYRFDFKGTLATSQAKVGFYLATNEIPFEFADVRLQNAPDRLPNNFRKISLPGGAGHGASVCELPDSPNVTRVDEIVSRENIPWHLQLDQAVYSIQKGKKYLLRGKVRSDGQRGLSIAVQQANPPYHPISRAQSFRLTSQWSPIEMEFEAANDEPEASINIRFGDSEIPFEIEGLLLYCEGTALFPHPPIPPSPGLSDPDGKK